MRHWVIVSSQWIGFGPKVDGPQGHSLVDDLWWVAWNRGITAVHRVLATQASSASAEFAQSPDLITRQCS